MLYTDGDQRMVKEVFENEKINIKNKNNERQVAFIDSTSFFSSDNHKETNQSQMDQNKQPNLHPQRQQIQLPIHDDVESQPILDNPPAVVLHDVKSSLPISDTTNDITINERNKWLQEKSTINRQIKCIRPWIIMSVVVATFAYIVYFIYNDFVSSIPPIQLYDNKGHIIRNTILSQFSCDDFQPQERVFLDDVRNVSTLNITNGYTDIVYKNQRVNISLTVELQDICSSMYERRTKNESCLCFFEYGIYLNSVCFFNQQLNTVEITLTINLLAASDDQLTYRLESPVQTKRELYSFPKEIILEYHNGIRHKKLRDQQELSVCILSCYYVVHK